MHLFGVHPIDTGGIAMAARRAAAAGFDTVQIFTAIPTYYGDKVSIKPERIQRFHDALKEIAWTPERVMVHAPYVLNVATSDETKWARARDGLAKELARSTALGAGAVCFHPGSVPDGNREAAGERVAAAIVNALAQVDGNTRLLVENTAGAGNTFARTAAEVRDILRHVPKSLRHRTGYGLDTCHLYASGYDIAASGEQLTATLDEFEEATGEVPGFFHLNDSEGELGSNRDRHTLLGDGRIGVEPFRWLVADRRSRGIPLILETPELNSEIAEDDPAPDPYDTQMAVLVKSLAPRA